MSDATIDTESRAAELLENLEADALDFAAQTRTLIEAVAMQLHRINDPAQRAVAADAVRHQVAELAGVADHWPTPTRTAVTHAVDRARGEIDEDGASVASYCRTTRLPFVVVLGADGALLRASTGKPRTPAEQAEAERQATRAVRAEQGLRVVGGDDDDPLVH